MLFERENFFECFHVVTTELRWDGYERVDGEMGPKWKEQASKKMKPGIKRIKVTKPEQNKNTSGTKPTQEQRKSYKYLTKLLKNKSIHCKMYFIKYINCKRTNWNCNIKQKIGK